MAGEWDVTFTWHNPPSAIARRIASPQILSMMASEWHRLYTPFVPMDTGNLYRVVEYDTQENSGVIVHKMPYAAKQYYGYPNKSKAQHPLASMQWDKAAKAAGKAEALANSVKGALGI